MCCSTNNRTLHRLVNIVMTSFQRNTVKPVVIHILVALGKLEKCC